jgi:hypothetical protein
MPTDISPDDITPDVQLRELAVLFTRGVLRLQKHRRTASTSTSSKVPESQPHCLDVRDEMRLSVTRG